MSDRRMVRIPPSAVAFFTVLLFVGGCTVGSSLWTRLQAGERQATRSVVEELGLDTLSGSAGVAGQDDGRPGPPVPDTLLRLPTREISLSAARHACQQAVRTNRALLERLQPPRTIHVFEEGPDAGRRAQD